MFYHKKSFSRDIYYCRRKDDLSCKARVSIDQKTGLIVSWISEHCHDNDLAQQKIKQLVSKEIDRAVENPHLYARSIHQKVAAAMMSYKQLASSMAFLPTSEVMRKQMQYKRKMSFNFTPVPKDWTFSIPPEFKYTADGEQFLIGDTPVPGRIGRVLSFCSPTGISLLINSEEIFGDGTFEITNCTKFSQLWVACVRLKNVVIPCFYSFLPTKELVTYRVMFSHLKQAMGENFPSVFHVDYEQAVLRCIGETFPESRTQGCIVHFKRFV